MNPYHFPQNINDLGKDALTLFMGEIKFGICGDLDFQNTRDKENPLVTLQDDKIGVLIYEINDGGMDKEYLFSQYSGLRDEVEKLLDLGALREDDGTVFLNFTFVDEGDMDHILEVTDGYASDLAEKISTEKEEIFSVLKRYGNKDVELEKLAFMIIGCYLLDWGMLELLRSWNIADHMKEQPGGNRYLLWGEKEVEHSLKEVYWDGHSFIAGGYNFHTFGDHSAETKRYAFPDLIWSFRELEFDGWSEMRYLLFEKRKELLEELGYILDEIGKNGAGIEELDGFSNLSKKLVLLKKLSYVQETRSEDGEIKVALKIPYFDGEDIGLILETMRTAAPAVKEWLDDNMDTIKEDMQKIKPIKNGVPFKEVFIQIWHYIFGLTNKHLARKGLLFNTYSEESDHKGYQPAVMAKGVLEEVESDLLGDEDEV